jgi:glycosyltransferase involved in cell wall biosynthesis
MPDAVGVLALVSDDWAIAPQRRHQILTRLASYFPVAWISPAHHWRERFTRRRDAGDAESTTDAGRLFVVESANGFPRIDHPRRLREALLRRRVSRGARWLRDRGCTKIELQIWNPEFGAAISWLPDASTSYHIDDEYSWATEPRPMSGDERRLIERVDRLYVTSSGLLESKGGINANTIFSPNGVDYAAFSEPATEPRDLTRIPHPRVGYVGVIKEQIDLDLLATLARDHASWSFVFVGPVRTVHRSLREPLARLRQLPNVHLLGERRPALLPAYLQHVDVAVLPYRRNAYTDCVNPMKLYEALAAGTPVVGSRIKTLEQFSSVAMLADTDDEWATRIRDALVGESRSEGRRAARQVVARDYDWDAITAPIADAIARRWNVRGAATARA